MMQEISIKVRTQFAHYYTKQGRVEIFRGVVLVAFGLLLVFLTKFTIDFLNHLVSAYLLVDGVMDIGKVALVRSEKMRKLPKYLFGMMSVVLGVLGLIFSLTNVLLIVAVIAVRILTRGARVIIDARQSQRKYEGLAWLLGLLFMLCAVILLLTTSLQYVFTLDLIVLLLAFYALIDGLYLLIRGIILRLRASFLAALIAKVPDGLLDAPEILPATTRRALVFVRHSGANGLGHVGWAFEWANGWFNVGAVENENSRPFETPAEMGFWSAHTLDPIETVQKHVKLYEEYKIFYVTQPHMKEAWKTVIWESRQPYTVFRQNCSDVVYDILRAYGVPELIDPVEAPEPNDWYDALPGRGYSIDTNPKIPIHLHTFSKRALPTQEILLTIPAHVAGTPPAWRVNGWRTWQELNFVLDKMLRDMRTLFVSIGHLIRRGVTLCAPARQRRSS
jgi:uncharacterized membrane protein HdeD (DUF308 family)